MGKTETENAINFEPHTFHIFGGLACPAAFVNAGLIMEFHVTLCFWQDAGEKFHTLLHIANSLPVRVDGELPTQRGCPTDHDLETSFVK